MNSLPVIKAAEPDFIKEGSSLFQSGFWASFKSHFGWKPYYFLLNDKNLIALVRSFKGLFSICYIPYAPDFEDKEHIAYIADTIQKYLPENCLFIRFDLSWKLDKHIIAESDSAVSGNKISSSEEIDTVKPDVEYSNYSCLKLFEKSQIDIQPPSTVILDLIPDNEQILKGMKSKTRYNIRLSQRKGVIVRQYGLEALEEWYEIYKETGERDKIALHSFDYYKKLFILSESEKDSPDLRIYMAEHEGENIAGIISSFYNKKAVYLYGASLNKKRETMPAYSLQWQAIQDAKQSGCLSYDFFGIPPADEPSHPMHGLYRFKTGFGGEIIHKTGCYDYKLKKYQYFIYRKAEALRNFYFKKLKKR